MFSMKAIVEKSSSSPHFQVIIEAISSAKNEAWLRDRFRGRQTEKALSNGFKIGFGGYHMWVADAATDERLILVPFN